MKFLHQEAVFYTVWSTSDVDYGLFDAPTRCVCILSDIRHVLPVNVLRCRSCILLFALPVSSDGAIHDADLRGKKKQNIIVSFLMNCSGWEMNFLWLLEFTKSAQPSVPRNNKGKVKSYSREKARHKRSDENNLYIKYLKVKSNYIWFRLISISVIIYQVIHDVRLHRSKVTLIKVFHY